MGNSGPAVDLLGKSQHSYYHLVTHGMVWVIVFKIDSTSLIALLIFIFYNTPPTPPPPTRTTLSR